MIERNLPCGCVPPRCTGHEAVTSNLSMIQVLRAHATAASKMELDLTGAICYDAADEIERLTAALTACQTYDYRTIIDESDRLRAALSEAIDYVEADSSEGLEISNNWRELLGRPTVAIQPSETPLNDLGESK